MSQAAIICLPDLLRGTRTFPEGFFDLIREPIRQACKTDIGFPAGSKKPHNLSPAFNIERFRQLAGSDGSLSCAAWQAHYHALPDAAAAYLDAHLPDNTLYLCFEMPPWLASILNKRSLGFIDIRPSPLRFGSDLYIAMRTNLPFLATRITTFSIPEEELKLEANYLAASVRMHQRRLTEEGRYQFELGRALIYIGQAPFDASLLSAGKTEALRCEDFAEKLKSLARGQRLLYKAHPFAPEHAAQEMLGLKRITGQSIELCQQNAYQLLSSEDHLEFVGISSGFLQEAAWFDKTTHMLFQPYVPINYQGPEDAENYQQVHFQSFLSPDFWHQLLSPDRPAPRVGRVTPQAHHHARQLLDQWWDYSKVMTWEKSLPVESFLRAGGGALQTRLAALEARLAKETHLPRNDDS